MVSIDSSNSFLGEDCPGEREMAEYVVSFLRHLNFEVKEQEVHPGRNNILATLPGCGHILEKGSISTKPVLLFEIHLDTVARSSMEEQYRDPLWEGDRLYGRGSCDTKGSLASLLLAFENLKGISPENLSVLPILCAVVDEEVGATGAMAFIDSGIRADAAIVGEPTKLVPCIGHKGLVRWEIETFGKACHSSTANLGINAIMKMNLVLSELADIEKELPLRAHPLVGAPTLNVGTIRGGTQNNVVPDHCVIDIDRRTVPGEDPEEILKDADMMLERLASNNDNFTYRRSAPSLIDLPVCSDLDEPVVRAALEACERLSGEKAEPGILTCSSDASKLGPLAGIPCVILGPGNLEQAHTADEYVDLEEVLKCSLLYSWIIQDYTS